MVEAVALNIDDKIFWDIACSPSILMFNYIPATPTLFSLFQEPNMKPNQLELVRNERQSIQLLKNLENCE